MIEKLSAIDGVDVVFDQPRFHEVVLRLKQSSADVLNTLADQNILAGYDLSMDYPVKDYPELENCILVCATELRVVEDIEILAAALVDALKLL